MEIKISKSARNCAACERAFVHEEELTSLVRLVGGEFVREDYCADCWRTDLTGDAFSVWSLRFYDPKVAEQEPPEVFSPLRQVFYEAVDCDTRVGAAVAYLAAQLLRRQKVFRLLKESEGTDGEERVALFVDRIADRLIEVRDPSLTFGEMENGRRELMERLNRLENPPPEESPENAQENL